uniref:Ankyrin repeat and MYND domain containing 1 n=1 Tax=Poecilia reticulata TaxID=8081 RepID=A0A3P9QGY1_POERE
MAEMPSSSEGVPDTDGEGGSRGGSRVAVFGEVKREGFGVQEWPDGSKYEGEFLDDFKHGKGRYSWKNGELYEGFFYKDFKHGVGAYSWPSGHKFIGKFYLNRKEGYGCLNYPGGAIFQVNCNNDVIHLLLDGGADIDKMNNEGMSALAVCLVLYYPFESMLSTLIQPPTDTPVRQRIAVSGIAESEETLQQSAELLTLAKRAPQCDSEEIIRKMTLKEIEPGVRLTTLKLLLDRGADPNCCRVPMPVLFLPIMAGDTEVVHKLLMCGARTDIPQLANKGFYPLHVAAALHGSEGAQITEMLLHAVTEPDSRACDQEEIYQPDLVVKLDETEDMSLRDGGRTALHIACQRDGDYSNACKVVELLLSHGASTDLLWSGHSPLSLAIASGNDEAVEEILKAGADPNLPLGRRVGSALCALANFNYRLGGDRIKVVNSNDVRFARTPFHALNMQERALIKNWRHLLSLMAKLLRKSARSIHGKTPPKPPRYTHYFDLLPLQSAFHTALLKPRDCKSFLRLPAVKFCYHCGRSVFVKLAICGRCQRVYYCSKSCKMKSWDENHKEECLQMAVILLSSIFTIE